MNNLTTFAYKAIKKTKLHIAFGFWTVFTRIQLRINNITYGQRLKAWGHARINVSKGGKVRIGDDFRIRTGLFYTEIGNIGSRILVGHKGVLTIGNNVGMSNATIVSESSVAIGNNVLIGGGVQIFDTNFHSMDALIRKNGNELPDEVKTAPITIGNGVFIGVNAIICKGVNIGDNVVIAAGSVVVKSIPADEVWGGNPAKKIR